MKETFTDDSSAVGTGWNRLHFRGTYTDGNVVTPYGIVQVYSQDEFTIMTFVIEGRMYRREWKRGYTERGLVRLAKQFAKEYAK